VPGFDQLAYVRVLIRRAAAEAQADGFEFGVLKTRGAKASTYRAQKFFATFRFPNVIARTAAAHAEHSTGFVAHERGGARLSAVDAQEQLHQFTTLYMRAP
jgi:predicted alpha/beta hydrolase